MLLPLPPPYIALPSAFNEGLNEWGLPLGVIQLVEQNAATGALTGANGVAVVLHCAMAGSANTAAMMITIVLFIRRLIIHCLSAFNLFNRHTCHVVHLTVADDEYVIVNHNLADCGLLTADD